MGFNMKSFRQYLKEWVAPYRLVYVDQHGDDVMFDDIDAKEDADAIKKGRIQWDKMVRRGDAGPGTEIAELRVKRNLGSNKFMSIRTIY